MTHVLRGPREQVQDPIGQRGSQLDPPAEERSVRRPLYRAGQLHLIVAARREATRRDQDLCEQTRVLVWFYDLI
jgi:hypothetical protein